MKTKKIHFAITFDARMMVASYDLTLYSGCHCANARYWVCLSFFSLSVSRLLNSLFVFFLKYSVVASVQQGALA